MTAAPSSRPNLGQILERLHLVTPDQVQTALAHQKKTGRLFGECLIELGFTAEDDVSWALSSQLGLPFVNVEASMADPDLVAQYPPEFLRRNLVLPLVSGEDELSVVLADPTDEVTLARLRWISGKKLNVAVATSTALRTALNEILGPPTDDEASPEGETDGTAGAGNGVSSLASPELTRLLDRALSEEASAIFLDPEDRKVRVRLRVAGTLREGGAFPTKALETLPETLEGWLGKPDVSLPGVKRWTAAAASPGQVPVQALVVTGRDGVSVTLLLDAMERPAERVTASFEAEWARFDELPARPRGLLLGAAPSPAERGRLLARMVGSVDLSKRRGWALAPADLTLPGQLACFPGDPDRAARACPVGALMPKRVGYEVPVGKRLYDHQPIGSDIEQGTATE